MKCYKGQITLVKNSRGCYILDTIKGCRVCNKEKPLGCYNDCYAKNISTRYGFDFSSPVKRDFIKDPYQMYLFGFHDTRHENQIIQAIKKIDMPFVRIGEMGDPSEDWSHTIQVCKVIARANKHIVIITKHWKTIPNNLLYNIKGITINTSISALDNQQELQHRVNQFNRLKDYCNSVLRIVTCDFNKETPEGKARNLIQQQLLAEPRKIDTIFRPSIKNPLVINGVIKTQQAKFLKSSGLASKHSDNVYFGDRAGCKEMCGINIA